MISVFKSHLILLYNRSTTRNEPLKEFKEPNYHEIHVTVSVCNLTITVSQFR